MNNISTSVKKLMLIFLVSIAGKFSFAQYVLTSISKTYVPLANPISLNKDKSWGGVIKLPFTFKLYGKDFDSVNVAGGGGIDFPSGMPGLFVYHTPFGGYMLRDKGYSTLGYEISGTAGNRIVKAEWKNAGFSQWYTTSDTADYVDFQIWLYENDYHFEIHFGSNHTDDGTYTEYINSGVAGPSVKLWFDTCNDVLFVFGDANNPSYEISSGCQAHYRFINATPSTGMVYIFKPGTTTNIIESSLDQINLYPNPFSESITCTFPEEQKNATILITDLLGKKIKEIKVNGKQQIIESGEMNNGVYFFQIVDENKNISQKKIVLSKGEK